MTLAARPSVPAPFCTCTATGSGVVVVASACTEPDAADLIDEERLHDLLDLLVVA